MGPTKILKKEHEVIKIVLDILDVIVSDIMAKKPVNLRHMEEIVDFIRTFADKCHHGKEQDLLFPAMEEAGIPRNGGPIEVMLEEHDIGRNYVRQLAKAITDYRKGNKKSLMQKMLQDMSISYANI